MQGELDNAAVGAEHFVALHPEFAEVIAGAAQLQDVVPDAVLVGGRASALYAGHRVSFDHDHVLQLRDRYLAVLEAVEATDGWATSVRASKPPMTILGKLGGVEAGLRQLRRTSPLQTRLITITDAADAEHTVRIPTRAETLRVKAYLVVQRNQVRDYLDVAAMAEAMGLPAAAETLLHLDDFYADRSADDESVLSALVQRLAAPEPRDAATLADLPHYKHLAPRWHRWAAVTEVCRDLAQRLLSGEPGPEDDG